MLTFIVLLMAAGIVAVYFKRIHRRNQARRIVQLEGRQREFMVAFNRVSAFCGQFAFDWDIQKRLVAAKDAYVEARFALEVGQRRESQGHLAQAELYLNRALTRAQAFKNLWESFDFISSRTV